MRAHHFFRVFVLAWLAGTALAGDQLILWPEKSGMEGKWELDLKRYAQRRGGLNLEFREGRNNHWQWIDGERAPKIEKVKSGGEVTFLIPGKAGDLRFSGEVDGNLGLGRYLFQANRGFAGEAGKLLKTELGDDDLLELAIAEVTLDYIKEVQGAGVMAVFDEVLSLRRHGLKGEAVREYAESGFKKPADMVRLRNHGVMPEYARKAQAVGYGKEADELVRLRNSGVTPEYLSEWKATGFSPDAGEVIRLRNHGLQASYAAAWKKGGFDFSFDELIKARNAGVPADFAAALQETGKKPSLEEVIRLRNFGVKADYYRELKMLDPKYSTADIVKFRQFGVSSDYVKAMRSGGASFSAEEIVKLRNSGVPADFVTALNVEGRKPLDVAAIIELRNRGISAETARKLRQ